MASHLIPGSTVGTLGQSESFHSSSSAPLVRLHRQKPAVLLLHGLSGNPLELQHLARRLRDNGYFVESSPIPGYAFGTRERAYDMGTWREWLNVALERFDALSAAHESVFISGLCIGAVLAMMVALERPGQVSGLSLISTTLAYDGWATPWYRSLVNLGYHTPLRNMISIAEKHPYGLKNERMRDWVARAMASHGDSAAGAARLPLTGIYQAQRMIKTVRQRMSEIHAPALVLHAVEDDVASPKSAEFVASHIGSEEIRTVLFNNSYHMLTLDNDRDAVAEETLGFFARMIAARDTRQEHHAERSSNLTLSA